MTETQTPHRVAGDELRAFVERVERVDSEKQVAMDARKDILAEAKGRGYCPKTIAKVIALRKREPDDIAEEEAVMEMYKQALGMN
jgi:uncharacterized protein (UPF0335 family)